MIFVTTWSSPQCECIFPCDPQARELSPASWGDLIRTSDPFKMRNFWKRIAQNRSEKQLKRKPQPLRRPSLLSHRLSKPATVEKLSKNWQLFKNLSTDLSTITIVICSYSNLDNHLRLKLPWTILCPLPPQYWGEPERFSILVNFQIETASALQLFHKQGVGFNVLILSHLIVGPNTVRQVIQLYFGAE